MKNKLKQLFKIGIITFGIALLTTNCQKDDETLLEESKVSKSNLNLTSLRTKDIEKNTNLKRIINKAEKKVSNNKAGRTVYNADYDFTINTSYAKVIENNGLKNYTFGVYRDSINGLLENLLLEEQADSTFKVSLVQYNITETERTGLINRQIVDVENKISFIELADISDSIFNKEDASSQTCIVTSYEWFYGVNCSAGGNHSYSDGEYSDSNLGGCHAWGTNSMASWSGWVLVTGTQDCGGGGSTPNGPSSPPSGNPSGGNPNGGSGTYTIPPETTPVLCPECPEIDDDDECFISDEDFNAPYSANSPFTVDLSEVRLSCDIITPPENEKFMCVYNKLVASAKFKDLFIDTFDESENLNVTFEVTNIPPIIIDGETYNPNGDCVITSFSPSTGTVTSVDVRIRIDDNYLNTASSFDLARTILHESIHAYLQLKMKNCNLGTSLEDLNNTSLESLLSQYFDNCAAGQEEHEFMFDEMIPTMQIILSQIRDSFLTPQEISDAESQSTFENEDPNAINGLPYQSWNWQQFYYYFSLRGLGNTEAFQNEITESKATNFQDYKTYANTHFNTPCND